MYRHQAQDPTYSKFFRCLNTLLSSSLTPKHGTPVALRKSPSPRNKNDGVWPSTNFDSLGGAAAVGYVEVMLMAFVRWVPEGQIERRWVPYDLKKFIPFTRSDMCESF
jgi:hypothetical protein